MEKINSAIGLRTAILQLEIAQAEEGKMMKEQFHLVQESLKPVNLIKSAFKEVAASHDLKEHVLTTSVGLASGYIAKKLFEGVTNVPLKKLLGTALMFGISNTVAKNPEAVKSFARGIFKFIRHKSGAGINRIEIHPNEIGEPAS